MIIVHVVEIKKKGEGQRNVAKEKWANTTTTTTTTKST